MITVKKQNIFKASKSTKNESVDDPHELLLSLVDMGSLDIEEVLLACVKEMSDSECKRVLSGLSLPNCCDIEDEPDTDMTDDMDAMFNDDETEDEPNTMDDTVKPDIEVEPEDAADESCNKEDENELKKQNRKR